ncbi:MAG: hypothetical protein ACREOH_15895 [Candidatus Entotheonellia bacterium]
MAPLQRVATTLDQWRVPEPPEGLVERTLARVRDETTDALSAGGRAGIAPLTPLLALVLGGLAAGTSLGLTAYLTPYQGSSLTLATLGILWAVLGGPTGLWLARHRVATSA